MKEDMKKDCCPFTKMKECWLNYKPLIIIVLFCLLLATVRTESFMYSFMGYFFIFLSLFKFFDLDGFVEGFSTYDLIAMKARTYGYVYPFIEFFLGMNFLGEADLYLTNWIALIVMTISGIGVIKSVQEGRQINCACLGTVLNVPLSSVSIIENLGMGAMAAYKLMFT